MSGLAALLLGIDPTLTTAQLASRLVASADDLGVYAACVRVAQAARETGTIVSADIDNVYDGLPELLPLLDILIGSKEFPRRVTGIADERAALVELQTRYGCAVVGMTMRVCKVNSYCFQV